MVTRDAGSRTVPSAPGLGAETRGMVEVSGVRKRFGGVIALDGIDLTIPAGAMVGLIGPNGAGKSTLFDVITGVVAPDEGTVRLDGVPVTGGSVAEIARAGIARTFQTPRGFSSMTVLENLLVAPPSPGERLSGVLRSWRRASKGAVGRAEEVLARIGLSELRDVPYPNLSVGQARLLEIGRHLMRDFKVLLLDEPTAGVPPAMQRRLRGLLEQLNAEGVTIVVVEHNLGFVLPLASTVFVLDRGRIIAAGAPREIGRHPAVIAAYLGRERG